MQQLYNPNHADKYSEQLEQGFGFLRFNGALEQEFRQHIQIQQRRSTLICIIVAGFIWSIFIVVDFVRQYNVGLVSFGDPIFISWLFIRWNVWLLILSTICFLSMTRLSYRTAALLVYFSCSFGSIISANLLRSYGIIEVIDTDVVLVIAAFLPIGLVFTEALAISIVVCSFSLFVITLNIGDRDLYESIQVTVIALLTVPIAAIGSYLREHSERKQFLTHNIYRKQAMLDPLTGIANRRHFDQHCKMALKEALRSKTPATLALLDIDFFKLYNDAYGHLAGDVALIAIAKCIEKNVQRPLDIAARFGGEEFTIFLYGTSPEQAFTVLNQIQADIKKLNIQHTRSPHKLVTVSMGVVSANSTNLNELLHRADMALYDAKASGRSLIRIAA